MKIVKMLLKPFSFVPALLMMYVIFSFSAQTGEVSGDLSYKISYKIVETKNELFNENKSPEELSLCGGWNSSLCKKSSAYDRVFPAGSCHFFSIVCVRCEGNLADDPGRDRMCGIRGAG